MTTVERNHHIVHEHLNFVHQNFTERLNNDRNSNSLRFMTLLSLEDDVDLCNPFFKTVVDGNKFILAANVIEDDFVVSRPLALMSVATDAYSGELKLFLIKRLRKPNSNKFNLMYRISPFDEAKIHEEWIDFISESRFEKLQRYFKNQPGYSQLSNLFLT